MVQTCLQIQLCVNGEQQEKRWDLKKLALRPESTHRGEVRRSGACGLPVYESTLSLRRRAEENVVQFFPQRMYLSKIIYHLYDVHYSNTIYCVGSVLSLDLKMGMQKLMRVDLCSQVSEWLVYGCPRCRFPHVPRSFLLDLCVWVHKYMDIHIPQYTCRGKTTI